MFVGDVSFVTQWEIAQVSKEFTLMCAHGWEA